MGGEDESKEIHCNNSNEIWVAWTRVEVREEVIFWVYQSSEGLDAHYQRIRGIKDEL